MYCSGSARMTGEIRKHAGLEVLGGGEDNGAVGSTVDEVVKEVLDPAVRVVVMAT